MKRTSFIYAIALLFCVVFTGNAQTVKPGDFAGKWDILVKGTPDGDSKLVADLVREGGVLSGQLVNPTDSTAEKIPVTVTENGNKLSLAFSAQGYDVTIDLDKVDDDNLKGSLMNMFETTAKRIK